MGIIGKVLGKVLIAGQRGDGQMAHVAVDDLGQLKVVGAGVATSSDIRIKDAIAGQFATVDGDGKLSVKTDPVTISGAATLESRLDTIAGYVDTVEAKLQTLIDATDTVETKLQSLIDTTPALTLTARMKAGQPTSGYRIWSDTADANYIYLAEAVLAQSDQTQEAWRGIRIPKDANGNLVGEWQESTAFRWDNKTSTTGWS